MYPRFPLIVLLLCIAWKGIAQDGIYEINGKLNNRASGIVRLAVFDEKGNAVNSRAEIKNHRFTFSGRLADKAKASLSIDGLPGTVSIFMDTGRIAIDLAIDTVGQEGKRVHQLVITRVEGSQGQSLWEESLDHLRKIRECEAPDSVKAEDNFNLLQGLVQRHPDQYVTRELLMYQNTLSYEQLKKLLQQLPESQRSSATGKALQRRMGKLRGTLAHTFIYFPEQRTIDDKPFMLDQLEFKYLLIDFWASWCAPCRLQNERLKPIYEAYRSKGFEVLGVTLDTDRNSWLKAIAANRLPWKQVGDLKGWQTPVAAHYSIRAIPYNLLIDRAGRIVGSDLHGEQLRKKLAELLKQ